MDIVGPLLEAPWKLKYLIVAIDYFTKWLEAKPVTSITGRQVKIFAFDNIVCRFGVPDTIITDNETQLINEPFKSWAEGLEIKEGAGWVEELPNVLWAHRLMPKTNNGKPHSLAYGTEAVILAKIESTGKLGPKWEGPYKVIEAYGTGAYKLRSMDGKEVPRTWHSSNL
ncbi:reverse transcriptase domain-containing protein [Tanacetum coccineum]